MAFEWELVMALQFVECSIVTILNIMASSTIFKSKTLRRFLNDYILLSLFITHALVGALNVVTVCMYWAGYPWSITNYVLITRDSVAGFEIYFTIIQSIERYVAIRKPFFYARLGKLHAVLFLSATSVFPLAFCVGRIYTAATLFFGCLVTILGGIFISATNIFLYRSVKKQCREITKTIIDRSEEKQKDRRKVMKKRKLRSLKMCIYITITYLLTWCPLVAFAIINVMIGLNIYYIMAATLIGFSNGIWDVLIYFYFNAKSWRVLKTLFGRKTNTIGHEDSSSMFISTIGSTKNLPSQSINNRLNLYSEHQP
eukprot:TCONS_00058782-protein